MLPAAPDYSQTFRHSRVHIGQGSVQGVEIGVEALPGVRFDALHAAFSAFIPRLSKDRAAPNLRNFSRQKTRLTSSEESLTCPCKLPAFVSTLTIPLGDWKKLDKSPSWSIRDSQRAESVNT